MSSRVPQPLRRRLFALAAVAMLPLALMAGAGLYSLNEHQNAQAERVGREFARSVAVAVDAEHRLATTVLETVATTPTLDVTDLAAFFDRAHRIVETQPDWEAVILTDLDGVRLLDTRYPAGDMAQGLVEPESFQRVVRTRQPAVGSLAQGHNGRWFFPVRVPVIRNGTLKFVLTAIVRPAAIQHTVNRQALPGDWVISIIDRRGRRVARSRAHEETVGGFLSPSAQQLVASGGNEGYGVSTSLEGDRIYTPYSRLEPNGWAAVLGIPTRQVDAAVRNSVAVFGGGILLSLLMGTLGAIWVAGSITRPIVDLRDAAEALGRNESLSVPQTSIAEVRSVGAALQAASRDLARVERDREELLRKERLAREAAERADRAKDEFMAVLSHELRTPLNAIYGWARLLQNEQVQDPALIARAKEAIVRNADAQVQLINELLDLARITSGKIQLQRRTVDMADLLQTAIDAVRPDAAAKQIFIETLTGADEYLVSGDPSRLQQIVWNLLVNAVKFTGDNGTITLHVDRFGDRIVVEVSDTGQGIHADVLPHVFDRFRQADSSSTRAKGGLGLGLALVKHLVDLHGGTVTARSAGPGAGATFIVSLPAAPPFADAASGLAPAISRTDDHRTLTRLDGLRVLVVDNDPDALQLAETILGTAGASVRTAMSAADAMAAVRAWRPDVLVSDIEMPGEDGYSLIQRIRAMPAEEGGDVPAIAFTAYGRTQDRARAIDTGFDMHVHKPIDPGELAALVAGVARHSGNRTASA